MQAVGPTNTFKNRLDDFWQYQEMVFNFKSELSGTGSRSGGKNFEHDKVIINT